MVGDSLQRVTSGPQRTVYSNPDFDSQMKRAACSPRPSWSPSSPTELTLGARWQPNGPLARGASTCSAGGSEFIFTDPERLR